MSGNAGRITSATNPNLTTSIISLCSILWIKAPIPLFCDKKNASKTKTTNTSAKGTIEEVVKNPSVKAIITESSVVNPKACLNCTLRIYAERIV